MSTGLDHFFFHVMVFIEMMMQLVDWRSYLVITLPYMEKGYWGLQY